MNSNNCIYESNWFLLSYQRKLSFIRAGFLEHVQQFSRLLEKFEVWVSCEAVSGIFDQFFLLDFLKWNSNLCQIYWIMALQLLKLVCFMVSKPWKRKMQISDLFWTTWPCFLRLKTLENNSNTGRVLQIFIKTLNLLSKGMLMNYKTRLSVKFLLRFVRFHWMLRYLLLKMIFSLFVPKIIFFAFLFKSSISLIFLQVHLFVCDSVWINFRPFSYVLTLFFIYMKLRFFSVPKVS